jgi:hypothetical protein
VSVSEEFKYAAHAAIAALVETPDDSVVFMLTGFGRPEKAVPIYLDQNAARDQAQAGGCLDCTYLGLWSDQWPGYPPAPHGMIWLFEKGIRGMRKGMRSGGGRLMYLEPFVDELRASQGDLVGNTASVLLHELQHALNRDHVLDDLEQSRALVTARGYAVRQERARGCGVCPGSAP